MRLAESTAHPRCVSAWLALDAARSRSRRCQLWQRGRSAISPTRRQKRGSVTTGQAISRGSVVELSVLLFALGHVRGKNRRCPKRANFCSHEGRAACQTRLTFAPPQGRRLATRLGAMQPRALTPPSQLSAIDAAPSLRYFVFTEPPFDAVIAAVNGTDRLIDDYSQYKHGGEIWWIRALVSRNLSSWRTSSWKDADVIVPPLPFGFCANDEHTQHPACVATRTASKALLEHAALAARPEAFLVLGTDWRLRGSRPLGDARGFTMGTKLPSDPDVGQARSLIVPFVSSAAGRQNGPAWWAPLQPVANATQLKRQWHQSWAQRPIRSLFVGQASSEQPALVSPATLLTRPRSRPHPRPCPYPRPRPTPTPTPTLTHTRRTRAKGTPPGSS